MMDNKIIFQQPDSHHFVVHDVATSSATSSASRIFQTSEVEEVIGLAAHLGA